MDGTFIIERMAVGNIVLRWFAKKIDHHTPMYNDTVYYRDVSSLYHDPVNFTFQERCLMGPVTGYTVEKCSE